MSSTLQPEAPDRDALVAERDEIAAKLCDYAISSRAYDARLARIDQIDASIEHAYAGRDAYQVAA